MATLVTSSAHAQQPGDVDVWIKQLSTSDWSQVRQAKDKLESLEISPVSALIQLMGDDRRVALTNTADLIYPGAKTFYGHGYLVNYDLDSIPVRAGWVLEELTFQDFGFRANSLEEKNLIEDTAKNGFKERPLPSATGSQPSEDFVIKHAVPAARSWWKNSEKNWTRFAALEEALSSHQESRQLSVLEFLRYGNTPCKSLDKQSYADKLLPIIRDLVKSDSESIRIQAGHLIKDGFYRKAK